MPLSTLMGGARAVDVANLSGVSQPTLSRLWGKPNWIEGVEGTTLAKLMAVSPAVSEYVRRWGERQRLEAVANVARAAGVHLRPAALADLVDTAPPATVIALLSATAEMMAGRYDNASRMFAAGWGRQTNEVADAFFKTGSTSIFENVDAILAAAQDFVSKPPGFADMTQVVGYGIVDHKLTTNGFAKAHGSRSHRDDLTFLTRSAAIARILTDGDMDFVEWYREHVFAHRDLVDMELWSHATYATDVPMRQRRLPKATSLTSTAAMTAVDLRGRNDAYVYYLLLVTLPLLQQMDPRFVDHHPSVRAGLQEARSRGDQRILRAATKLCAS